MMSFLDLILPVELIVKVIVIFVLGLVTVLGAYLIPRGKFIIVILGIIVIIIIWYVPLGIS